MSNKCTKCGIEMQATQLFTSTAYDCISSICNKPASSIMGSLKPFTNSQITNALKDIEDSIKTIGKSKVLVPRQGYAPYSQEPKLYERISPAGQFYLGYTENNGSLTLVCTDVSQYDDEYIVFENADSTYIEVVDEFVPETLYGISPSKYDTWSNPWLTKAECLQALAGYTKDTLIEAKWSNGSIITKVAESILDLGMWDKNEIQPMSGDICLGWRIKRND